MNRRWRRAQGSVGGSGSFFYTNADKDYVDDLKQPGVQGAGVDYNADIFVQNYRLVLRRAGWVRRRGANANILLIDLGLWGRGDEYRPA